MGAESKPADKTAAIDFSTWHIWPPTVAPACAEVVREALEQWPPEFSLPYYWHETGCDGRRGAAVANPLTIYVKLPFGAYQEEGAEWSITLEEIVEHELSIADFSRHAALTDMATELRRLADQIDRDVKDELEQTTDGKTESKTAYETGL